MTSANKLSAAQTKTLKSALKSAVGQDVQITSHVDPAILGGLVVKVGSRMIDGSLKSKLRKLEFAMKGIG